MDAATLVRMAVELVGVGKPFNTRSFSQRSGKHLVVPIGIGSALAKAVREGWLEVCREGSRRRGREYVVTSAGEAATMTRVT